jgi:hypothetical protein
MKKGKRSESQRDGRGRLVIYCLRSTLPLHILESLTTYYEKNCFVLNHGPNRHRVCRFLHATTGNNGNFDRAGDHESLTVAYTEETHGEEKSAQDRGIAIHHRIPGDHGVACAHTLKKKQKLGDRGQKGRTGKLCDQLTTKVS